LGVAEKNLRLQLARTTSGEIHPVLEEFRWGDRSYQIWGVIPAREFPAKADGRNLRTVTWVTLNSSVSLLNLKPQAPSW